MRPLPALLFALFAGIAAAQPVDLSRIEPDSVAVYQFTMNDDSRVTGHVLAIDAGTITVQSRSVGEVKLEKKKVNQVMLLDPGLVAQGLYWFPNPHATRHLFGPSAIPLRKGEGYYQNTYLLLNSVNVGVTNNLSLGAGFELLSLFSAGSQGPLYFVTAKGGFKVAERLHTAAGGVYASVPGADGDEDGDGRLGIGALYGQLTYGTREYQLTGSIGYGYTEDQLAEVPLITFGGMARLGRKVAFVSENWFFRMDEEPFTVLGYGLRFMGESVAVDLAFLNNANIVREIFIGIPYIDFVVKF